MPERKRRTRPWGDLKGPTDRANDIARLLRTWLDDAHLRIDDLRAQLTREHFRSGRIPSRSTIGERLAGVGLDEDIIQAVADVCSKDAAQRARMLKDVGPVTPHELLRPSHNARTLDATALANELVAVQRQSLTLQDKLLRAWERSVELEHQRTQTNHMVIVLLTMVDKLQRNISTLTAERDNVRGREHDSRCLQKVHKRLAHSEDQRRTAEAALKRAQADRDRADRLAEEAAKQVRSLTEQLERLRRRTGQPDNSPPLASHVPALAEPEAIEAAAQDIDDALVKACWHLDDGARRLDHVAQELVQDSAPDNLVASTPEKRHAPKDTDTEAAARDDLELGVLQHLRSIRKVPQDFAKLALTQSAEFTVGLMHVMLSSDDDWEMAYDLISIAAARGTPAHLCALTAELRARRNGESYAYELLNDIARERSPSDIVPIVTALRDAQQPADAYQLLTAVGRARASWYIPPVLANLNPADAAWVIETIMTERSALEIRIIRSTMRDGGHDHYASLLSVPPPDGSFAAVEPMSLKLGAAPRDLNRRLGFRGAVAMV
ncbi:hypothetical protein KVH02_34555 [Streptomyces olivaceus]|uniref:Uncharacterized protein n=1 Tax=Streptomyces olivaceus TaxID=47716 RepID=A0ABS7WFF4_STROV|nr:hypothetical protein [Streptomyces olivaceus]MBZ6093389.1 hypothetical protein [Streptomyces olivaceus]MBZ6100741.1 hypothetical protein [Streptomyces olivaceus]MBZ6121839.1 hypothetical protein [Streptomyces olivaceus]MBZ6156222.1 hypothetical protein [Streptomyces olivaceus]MBZ6303117.1 hypothetical protein [Streptomyces olivaceus]